ncbi:MAG: helix-turn-helix domain-containing protein, partial [Minisyncoccia bacterium]
MAIIGAKPDTGYTQFPNKIITNIEISMKAKLLWVYLYSKPTNYQFSFDRIDKDMKEGEVTIRTALKELETYGL